MKKLIILTMLLLAVPVFATVSDGESIRQSFTTNGSTTTFTFTFKCNSSDDVFVYSPVIATGLPRAPLVEDTDYTIAPTGGSYLNGGVVTIDPALAATVALRIVRRIKQSQETSSGAITPATIVAALDKLTREVQDAEDRKGRSLHIPDSDSVAFDMTIPNIIDRAGKILNFDESGNVGVTTGNDTFTVVNGIYESITTDDLITKSPWADVRAYGAVGNGTTDDSSAIQAAIDAVEAVGGGMVYFPHGDYDIDTTTLVIDNDYVRLKGEGRGTEILYSGTGTAISIGDSARSSIHCGIFGLTISKQGTARESGSIGVRVYGGQSITFRDCWFTSLETGILLDADGGTQDYLVGVNMLNNRFSQCKIALDIEATTTALWIHDLHVIGPGKTYSGSFGIRMASDVGSGNYFSKIIIDAMETGIMLSGESQNFFGVRLESCTIGIDFLDATVDGCSIYGAYFIFCTTDFGVPPATAVNNRIEVKGIMHLLTPSGQTDVKNTYIGGSTTDIALWHDGGTGLRWRYPGNYDVFKMGRTGTVEVVKGNLLCGVAGADQGRLSLTQGAGGTTPGYIKIYSPNGTIWYLFAENDGTVKVHNAIPTQNSDGSAIGNQS